ncbi:SRPBCC family protein [Microbacterium betulae]|uniref:SRPBCC family protein n=1 Tax=Microbacterium betulae TaxID=2981139 RepID=A0AA97FHJ3_9MICO|nr:SRPBCC family protein [Microbacterium sp. AB]WOF21637.1 SRPBCC family protein [Microbacterium sp. AB]
MARIIETIDVDVDVTTAYNQWTQFEEFPQFLDFVESIRQIDDETLAWKVTIGGAERAFTAKITEQHPDERVAWTSVSGDADHAGVVTFHKLSDATTRVTVQLDWEPTGAVETVGAALGFDDRAVKKDLAKFKEFIESRGSETGAWRGDVG